MAITVGDFTLTGFAFPVGVATCDYPAEGDVRLGVAYDDGDLVGTLFVPGMLLSDDDSPLSHSPADIVRRLLILLGAGVSPSNGAVWPIYASSEPGAPDDVVTVYDTAGVEDGRAMTDGELFRHFGFQVRVRSIDHPSGWSKASEVQDLLARSTYDLVVTMPDDTRYLVHCVSHIGEVIALGKEVPSSKRNLFTVNATVTLTTLPA